MKTNGSFDKLAKLVVQEVMRLHGILIFTILERDPHSTSNIWKRFYREMETKLKFITAFHPQTNGQSKQTI